jgi:hypothetical protein
MRVPVIVSAPPVKKILATPRPSIMMPDMMGDMIIPKLQPVSVSPIMDPIPMVCPT